MGMAGSAFKSMGWAALAASLAFAQAPLPTAYSGPWLGGTPPAGWSFSGLGIPDYVPDYDGLNDGAAKFDGASDSISIHYDSPAASVSFWIRGLTFSGGTFRVEQSPDGRDWTTLATFAPPPSNATYRTLAPSPHSRHLRFRYVRRATGNVGLDGVSVAKSPVFAIERFTPTAAPGGQASAARGTGGERERIDPAVDDPRSYRKVGVAP